MLMMWLMCLWSLLPTEPAENSRSRNAMARVKPALETRLEELKLSWGCPVYVRIFKQEMVLELWVGDAQGDYKLFGQYEVCSLSGTLGPKEKEGDLQGPEGFYELGPQLMNPWSSYHLSFNIGYPNGYDRKLGRTGGLIMVHGRCASLGCFAMRDEPIEVIYSMVASAFQHGQRKVRVDVYPFRMTTKNLSNYEQSAWLGFWREIKPGFDIFETTRRVPSVIVDRGKYVISPDSGH